MIPPASTYRLQLHREFSLRQAIDLVPYLSELGISHVYSSPLLKACPGSTHGYDVCDHSQLNPELGTTAELETLIATLRQHGMGLVLDIVPNHMGICGRDNAWWWDVLKQGRASPFAEYFDIDWHSPDPRLRGKVLVPVLGDYYGRILERGELQLVFELSEWMLSYHEHRFPLSPETATLPPDSEAAVVLNSDATQLDALIRQQHYWLADSRLGDTQLNYRRFFNIWSLAGIRVEDPRVFKATHDLILDWHARGWLDGIRVDHPDGLRGPTAYFERLRAAAPGAWIVAEKILQPGESISEDWPVAGTTGYDFVRRVTGLFIDPAGEQPLTDFYAEFTGEPTDYGEVVREKQRLVLRELLAAEVNWLTRLLVRISASYWRYRDLSEADFRETLIDITARLPVYCTYVQAHLGRVPETDEKVILETIAAGRQRRPDLPPEAFDLIENLLLLRLAGTAEQDFVMRFQQLTGPTMAKGAEDTAAYCYNRLLALNMVGGDPGRFGMSPLQFHHRCQEAQTHWPNSMLATSTHDTKRSEDVTMRLCLLSEISHDWRAAVQRWSAMNEKHRRQGWPDRNLEYFYYQTLVGAWPLPLERALPAINKAAREAKQHTSWSHPDPDYEAALNNFVRETLADKQFIPDLENFVNRLMEPGQVNSLAQTLIKLTAPGVPDTYQGTELWDLSLVDPDNRRPVDFKARRELASQAQTMPASAAWARRAEGLPKLWLIRHILKLRRAQPEWFGAKSSYEPLIAQGPKAHHVLAFSRARRLVTVVPRLVFGLNGAWGDTQLKLPTGVWKNSLTGEKVPHDRCKLQDLLRQFPVAFLVREEDEYQ